MRDITELVTIHRPLPTKRLPEPARQPTGTELHNVRHRHVSQGLKAGWGFEKSARCAAEYMRARYGYVPITDQEGFYLVEIGLTPRPPPPPMSPRNPPPPRCRT